ncbi:hypothetical protein ACFUNF_24715 [Streptomyces sp. NPDC057291]|uniref:hypothetical protein n=1 Tax=Streptomyces sp. NPDC057291 TaxID=3346087 RepID=UPI00362C9BC9
MAVDAGAVHGHEQSDRGRDVPLWSTLWDDSGRGGFPPVAAVFTKGLGTEARWRQRVRCCVDWQDVRGGER